MLISNALPVDCIEFGLVGTTGSLTLLPRSLQRGSDALFAIALQTGDQTRTWRRQNERLVQSTTESGSLPWTASVHWARSWSSHCTTVAGRMGGGCWSGSTRSGCADGWESIFSSCSRDS